MLKAAAKTVAHALDPRQDAIDLLKADHREVEALFEEWEQSEDQRKAGPIVKKICTALDEHAKLEEKLFYPKIKSEIPDLVDTTDEGIVEHAGIKRLVHELQGMKPSDEFFHAKTKVLMEYVKHHVKEEETELMPKVRESDIDLDELAEKLRVHRERLQAA